MCRHAPQATFTTSYIHTIIIYVVTIIFMFLVFSTSSVLGSIDKVGVDIEALSLVSIAKRGHQYLDDVIALHVW